MVAVSSRQPFWLETMEYHQQITRLRVADNFPASLLGPAFLAAVQQWRKELLFKSIKYFFSARAQHPKIEKLQTIKGLPDPGPLIWES